MRHDSIFSRASAVLAILVIFGTIGISTAHAGRKDKMEVFIGKWDNGNGWAQGSIGSARNSNDNSQYIGCKLSASAGYTNVVCEATDAVGRFAYCYSSDWRFIEAVKAMGSNSQIMFIWRDSYYCSYINISNDSRNEVAR